METTTVVTDILRPLAMQLPVILVCFTGLIVVVIRWRLLGSAAVPALLGVGFALLLAVVSPVIWAVVPRLLRDRPGSTMPLFFTVLGVVQSFLWALALGLLLLGLTMGRSQPPGPRS